MRIVLFSLVAIMAIAAFPAIAEARDVQDGYYRLDGSNGTVGYIDIKTVPDSDGLIKSYILYDEYGNVLEEGFLFYHGYEGHDWSSAGGMHVDWWWACGMNTWMLTHPTYFGATVSMTRVGPTQQ